MNRSLFIIFLTIALDAMGIGLVFPILPALLQDISPSHHTALYIGLLGSLYAAMQFIFSPILGTLSDRLGRRPILLLSLAGSVLNYLLLTFSHSFMLLLIGRIVAGMSSANMSVASAYLIDISVPEQRTKYFGLSSAMFGAGFVIGPVLGGLLGEYWLRLPFLVAALLSAINLLLAYFALPESGKALSSQPLCLTLNPFKAFQSLHNMLGVLPLMATFFIFSATGEAYAVCWALWGHAAFQWNGFWTGLSLGMFGLCQMLVQAFVPQHASKRFGNRNTVLIGMGCTGIALSIMALAQQGWIIFAIMPVFALGSIGTPALQALASQKVAAGQQGQFQGMVTSTVSLAAMCAPLFFSTLYFQLQSSWPGAIWLSVIALYLLALPVVLQAIQPDPATD